jgi:hypothetical protein
VALIDFEGGDYRGFFWVENLDAFMKGAAKWPSVQPCLPGREVDLPLSHVRGASLRRDADTTSIWRKPTILPW